MYAAGICYHDMVHLADGREESLLVSEALKELLSEYGSPQQWYATVQSIQDAMSPPMDSLFERFRAENPHLMRNEDAFAAFRHVLDDFPMRWRRKHNEYARRKA